MSTAEATHTPRAQQQLSDFLYAELLHTLGAYGLAEEKLHALRKGPGSTLQEETLFEVTDHSYLHNGALRSELHKPQPEDASTPRHRHPSPFIKHEAVLDEDLLGLVRVFYSTAVDALTLRLGAIAAGRENERGANESDGERLGRLFSYIHDPQRGGGRMGGATLVEDRLKRARHRLEKIEELTGGNGDASVADASQGRYTAILNEHMDLSAQDSEETGASKRKEMPLHLTVVKALSDAHDWMHQCEHLRSQAFKAMLLSIRELHTETEERLKRSIVLNTFVYVVARSIPWAFAEDEEERAQVIEEYENCKGRITPTYCMWIGNQLALLALERRAYTWWTMGRHDRAYRDFYKLTRLLKGMRDGVDERAMRVPGTTRLVVGLTATAEHHIGRIYRGQDAHRVAMRYFDRASAHLDGWEDDIEIGKIMRNSRWRVNLLISRGKANYELGRIKRSLLSYAEAWRAFLQLVESESPTTANLNLVGDLIAWLKSIESEPVLSKRELRERIEPLVRQFESVYSPVHLRLLAADIMMRFGHLLYVLKMPPRGWAQDDESCPRRPPPDYELPKRCILQAAMLDPTNTLIATDLLKIQHGLRLARDADEVGSDDNAGSEAKRDRPDPPMATLEEQWPGGGGRFEEAARAIEYVIQTWLSSKEGDEDRLPDQAKIARELLHSFLAHTDSSNVKLAQVYRHLMQRRREVDSHAIESAPTIEIICLRRYSSFFPFLPRPAAFRALGGGYLVQVREANNEPVGIAIDPGPHFLNNLYRCGYSLADIQMVVATHDHADHIASLDALLSLLGTRRMLGDPNFNSENRLLIVGNESVAERYRFFNHDLPVKLAKGSKALEQERVEDEEEKTRFVADKRSDVVRVMTFSEFDRIMRNPDRDRRRDELKEFGILSTPLGLRIQPVRTVDHFDAAGHVSQGFLLSMGRTKETRSSVLFTSDTGPQPTTPTPVASKNPPRHYFARGRKSLRGAAAEADIVVAHLSSVPLPELRRLASLPGDKLDDEQTQKFVELWKQASNQAWAWRKDDGAAEARELFRQLQFAFRSRGQNGRLSISPLNPTAAMKPPSEKHLYLAGLLDLATQMAGNGRRTGRKPLLLIGELREELGTFRTRIASRITETLFSEGSEGTALTADIGLRLRISRPEGADTARVSVLCSTCDLDNDLVTEERFHPPEEIHEVCVKGENESVFYNCELHDPGRQPDLLWVESVERYNVFGD